MWPVHFEVQVQLNFHTFLTRRPTTWTPPTTILHPSTPGRSEESRQQAQSHAQPQAQSAVDAPAAASQRLPSNHNTPNRQGAAGLEVCMLKIRTARAFNGPTQTFPFFSQRQLSGPDPPLGNLTLEHGLIFNKSTVTGVQSGNNNIMNINVTQSKRHPAAPVIIQPRQKRRNRKTPGKPS